MNDCFIPPIEPSRDEFGTIRTSECYWLKIYCYNPRNEPDTPPQFVSKLFGCGFDEKRSRDAVEKKVGWMRDRGLDFFYVKEYFPPVEDPGDNYYKI
jgi:hypothetical protein